MSASRTQVFIDFLVEELQLTDADMPTLGNWGRVGTTLGALCLKLNLMDMEQINNLLEYQEQSRALFGEVAIELGYLNEDQVSKLLNIQKWSRRVEILQRLLLAGKLDEEQYRELVAKVYLI